jgi:hypothetical protein
MTSLLEKGNEFKWTWECQESFNQLRFKLMADPVLISQIYIRVLIYIVMQAARFWDVCLCNKDTSSPTRHASCGNMT